MLAASGTVPCWQARFVPDAAQLDPGEGEGAPDHIGHVDGEDALAQVAQLDHQDHAVAPCRRRALRPRGAASTSSLGVAAHVGGGHHAVHLAEQG